jgi:hypothetical protein
LVKQKGYVKRELLKGKNGEWVDLVYWASEEDAQHAVQNSAASPVCGEYFSLMLFENPVTTGETVFHYKQMAQWE